MIEITSSTCASSTPARMVAWDCFRNPPCEWSRVTRKSLSVSASTSAPASSGCTIATTSFIGRRLYPEALLTPPDGQPKWVISGDAGLGHLEQSCPTLRHAASVARPVGREADRPGGGCPRPPCPLGGRHPRPRSGGDPRRRGGGSRPRPSRRKRGRPRGSDPPPPFPIARQGARGAPRPARRWETCAAAPARPP